MNLKSTVALLLLFLFSNTLTAQKPSKKSFEINVSVENLKAPAKLILTLREVGQWVEYTSESNDGQFVLSGAVKEPSFAWVVMKYGNEFDRSPRLSNILQLFVGNGHMQVKTRDSLRSSIVQAGVFQKELEELNASMKDWEDKRAVINGSQKISADLEKEKRTLIAHFAEQHPGSFVSLYALQNFSWDGSYTIDADAVAPLFQKLSDQIKNTLSGKELERDIGIAQRTAMGSPAPDFIQRDSADRPVSLSAFRGKYVLIDFWASWCKPCRIENPALVKVYETYKERNFTILGVSLDNNKGNWVKAIRKDRLHWTHVSDLKFWKNEVALLYGVKTVPQNYLVDPSGKIIGKNIRMEQLPLILKERLP